MMLHVRTSRKHACMHILEGLQRVLSIKDTEGIWAKQMIQVRPVAFDSVSVTSGRPLPSRSTVLRQSLLLAFSAQMTAAAAHGQTTSSAVGPSVKLRPGAQIPAVGLGVFLAR